MAVGTIVRVVLRGRRVRGWVVEVDVEPEAPTDDLRPLAKVSSTGPPSDLVELAGWAAWRWAGSRVPFLRAASPANVVRPGEVADRPAGPGGEGQPADDPEVESLATEARARRSVIVRWPPASRMAELLRRLSDRSGSTIVVVPDGERVALLARHLEHSGVGVVSFSADQTDAARTRSWRRARGGSCVVVGGRAAVWAPVPDLAAGILVDEADEAYKEERAPTWHARELLAERLTRAGGRLTIVTPVPTLEASELADGELRPARVRERNSWGQIVVVDRREEPPGAGMFSHRLVEEARTASTKGRVVCVLNRKGRARLLACGACGALVACEECGATVVEDEEGLRCDRCGTRRPRVCASCGSTALRRLRPGVSRLTEELVALMPRVAVAEVDARAEHVPEATVLVGTESVLHRVRSASLVAFLDFDQELFASRYRAAEQALWLLVRAVRLVGPRNEGGRVLVQTRAPDHEVLRAASSADPAVVSDVERARRRDLGFPPFRRIAEAVGEPEAVRVLAEAMGAAGLDVLGPVPEGASARLLVRAADTRELCDALARARPRAREHGRLRIDVEPLRA